MPVLEQTGVMPRSLAINQPGIHKSPVEHRFGCAVFCECKSLLKKDCADCVETGVVETIDSQRDIASFQFTLGSIETTLCFIPLVIDRVELRLFFAHTTIPSRCTSRLIANSAG